MTFLPYFNENTGIFRTFRTVMPEDEAQSECRKEPEKTTRNVHDSDAGKVLLDRSHLVVVVLVGKTEEPCDQKVCLPSVGNGHKLVCSLIDILGQKVDYVEVVDILDHLLRLLRSSVSLRSPLHSRASRCKNRSLLCRYRG